MRFEKGNKIGHRFTSENQPSGHEKSLGKRKAKSQRELLQTLLDSREPSDKAAEAVMKVMPHLTRDEVTMGHSIQLQVILRAESGNVKAYEKVMKVIGELAETHEITGSEGGPLPIAIRPFTDEEIEIIKRRSGL